MTDELDTTLVEDTLVVRKPKRKYTRRAKVITAPPEEPNVKSPPMRETTEAPTPPTKYEAWVPGADDFIDLKGKKYLPARRRVQWMRGQPVGHPDWTIDTEVVEHDRGKRISAVKVEGGYALVRANVFDETGRLIATGIKSEYSENFSDYIEKAETGAVARALALAGYGTESALDLDEGVDSGRIADAPVAPTVSGSALSGVGRGGTSTSATDPQVREVARLARTLGLDAEAIVDLVHQYTEVETTLLPADPELQSAALKDLFSKMSGTDIGRIVTALRVANEPEIREDLDPAGESR